MTQPRRGHSRSHVVIRVDPCPHAVARGEQGDHRTSDQPSGAAAADLRDDAHERLGADLLPDWSDDWLLVEQEAYRQRRLHALERLSAMLCGQQRYAEALRQFRLPAAARGRARTPALTGDPAARRAAARPAAGVLRPRPRPVAAASVKIGT